MSLEFQNGYPQFQDWGKAECEYCGGANYLFERECHKCGAPFFKNEAEMLHYDDPLPSQPYWIDGGNPTGYPGPSPYSEWSTDF